MTDILHDLSAQALAQVIEANAFALFERFRQWPQAEVHSGPDLLWTLTSIPFPLFNSVMRARLAPETADAAIEAAIARGTSRQVPVLWWVGPTTRPANLSALLEAHGFVSEGESPGMAVDLQALPEDLATPADLSVERVSSPETLRQWSAVLCAGFGLPDFVGGAMVEFSNIFGSEAHAPWHNYLARLNGEPVATSSLFLGAGVAGIYNVTTLPEAQRKGIGAAITLRPLRDAQAMGYRAGMLNSSQMGFSLYRKMGFKEYFKLAQYVWSGDGQNDDGWYGRMNSNPSATPPNTSTA